LMQAAGVCVWVENEAQLDAVTALSGSGPAYFFYLIEHMITSATALGLPYDSARELAVQTAVGAAAMARDAGSTPAELRQQVTSKGGTTHAAVSTFDHHNLPATIQAAMQAAHDRAVELGTEFGDT
jgi:pyrroline-5-carboxylate reductase